MFHANPQADHKCSHNPCANNAIATCINSSIMNLPVSTELTVIDIKVVEIVDRAFFMFNISVLLKELEHSYS
jgi:hypothetical protein